MTKLKSPKVFHCCRPAILKRVVCGHHLSRPAAKTSALVRLGTHSEGSVPGRRLISSGRPVLTEKCKPPAPTKPGWLRPNRVGYRFCFWAGRLEVAGRGRPNFREWSGPTIQGPQRRQSSEGLACPSLATGTALSNRSHTVIHISQRLARSCRASRRKLDADQSCDVRSLRVRGLRSRRMPPDRLAGQ